MQSPTVPMVIVFCLAAFVLILLLYLCMRRMRQPPEAAARDTRFDEMMLPGEPKDTRHRMSYFLVNSANTINTDYDYPKPDPDVDRTEALDEYRRLNRQAGLTPRGFAQIQQAREEIYDKILRRVVCAYAANTKRCMVTAAELLKIGPRYGKGERKSARCPAYVNPVDELSQYGVLQEIDGKIVASKVSARITAIEDMIANIGSNECDLETLYSHDTGTEYSAKALMKTYTKPALYSINLDLTTENKSSLQQLGDNKTEDDVVLIVGQTPYINALALFISDIMGVSNKDKQEIIMPANLGDLDGFLISRKHAQVLDFNDEQPEIDALISRSSVGEPIY